MEVIKKTHEEMKDALIKNANLFYNGYNTEIDDATYDAYLKLVKDDEPEFDIYSYIKYENDGLSVKHMLDDSPLVFRDFTKTNDIESIDSEEKFIELSKDYYILPKFDGSSTVTTYDAQGNLDKIVSRGDDEWGFLNTNKLRNKVINHRDGVRIQLGEAVVAKVNGGRAKANGMINSKYLQDDVDKFLTIIPFDFYLSDGTKTPNLDVLVDDYSVFSMIRDKGEYIYHKSGDVNDGAIIPCDGIVGYPKPEGAKYATEGETLRIIKLYFSEAKESIIRNIDWEPAETGVIHPVANFDTVEIDDTYVSRANLYNYQNVINKKYYPGVAVSVIKANMTIPDIKEVINPDDTEAQKYIESITCPYCGTKLIPYGNVDCICPNDSCEWWMQNLMLSVLYYYPELGTDYNYQLIYSAETFKDKLSVFKNMINKEIVNKFEDQKFLLDFIGIPRLNQAKYDGILSEVANGKSLKDACYLYLSDMQWEYFTTKESKIQKFKQLITF